ncbi:MAG: RNA polymerase sigma factor [Thermoguttaceae bacterium]|jgi:RNA polymerase sigma-70 factor (ECF subfamily)
MRKVVKPPQPSEREAAPRSTWTDERLLVEYRRCGDRHAFEELVYRYEKELYGYLRNYLGTREAAEDVFQQTFFQVHLKCDQFEPERKLRPWLYAVATNQAIDFQRHQRRHRMASLDQPMGGDSDGDACTLLELFDSPEPDPVQRSATFEQCETIRRAMDELSEPIRRAVVLVYFQGLKYREAAEVLSIPVGTVKSRIHAAMRKLTETLTPACCVDD